MNNKIINLTKGAFFGMGCGRDHAGLHTEEYEFNDNIIGTVIEIYKRLLFTFFS